MSLPFSTPPSKVSLTPFKVAIPKSKIRDLEVLLSIPSFAPRTYENSQTDGRYGVNTNWLKAMWNLWQQSYDW